MIKAIIIEDEQLSAERLARLVSEQEVEVIAELHSVKESMEWFSSHQIPDLVFLDIQLGDGTGLDILRQIESYPNVIFTTAFDQYVLDAFKFNSIDYLLKPVKAEALTGAIQKYHKTQPRNDFKQVLTQLDSHFQKPIKTKFLVKIGHQFHSVPVRDISYFFSKDGGTYIHSKDNKSYIIDQTLDEISELIDQKKFFRLNRKMIASFDSIKTIESYFNNRLIVKLDPSFDEDVIISRDKVKTFKEWLDN